MAVQKVKNTTPRVSGRSKSDSQELKSFLKKSARTSEYFRKIGLDDLGKVVDYARKRAQTG